MTKREELEDKNSSSTALHHVETASAGTAVIPADPIENPGVPAHHKRLTDLDQAAAKRASVQVGVLFFVSMLASIFSIYAYFAFPIEANNPQSVLLNNLFLGLGIGTAVFTIGIGIVHWARQLMVDTELVDERHPLRSDDEAREKAVEILKIANEESGIGRRTLLRNSLLGAVALAPLPAVVLFRDLAPAVDPNIVLKQTMWDKGVYLTLDPDGVTKVKASDVTLGSAFHIVPEGINKTEHPLNEKAKAIVLLMRLKPEELIELPERKNWSYDGIVAYSKVCTHVGCPVALYEQRTHHLLCPCHQSEFDVTRHCEVIFGPAKRPLPQLPITVDSEGYLVAQSDFHEPVGPSFWERAK